MKHDQRQDFLLDSHVIIGTIQRTEDAGNGMGQFRAAVSAMKCEMYFPLECHQSAKVRTTVVKRVGARFGLALVPIVQQ